VGRGSVLLEHVIAIWIVPAKPWDQMMLQKSNVDLCVDLEASWDEDGWAGLAVGGHDPEDHDARRGLCFVDWGT